MAQHQHTPCLAKRIHGAAWRQFAALLADKAAGASRRYVAVNPAYTSQERSRCGHRKTELTLAERTSACSCGGVVLDRDRTARKNSVRVGRHCLASAEKLPEFSGRVVTKSVSSVQWRLLVLSPVST
jgi:transposase